MMRGWLSGSHEAPKKVIAFLVEMTFHQKPMPAPMKMTTGVYVIPDVLPCGEGWEPLRAP